jgi:hypothetical protein
MFQYPLSYFIYSDGIDKLPGMAKDAPYRRRYEILSGTEKGLRYARFSVADRRAILDFLRETKPGAPHRTCGQNRVFARRYG